MHKILSDQDTSPYRTLCLIRTPLYKKTLPDQVTSLYRTICLIRTSLYTGHYV
jgi:hypothetical protein